MRTDLLTQWSMCRWKDFCIRTLPKGIERSVVIWLINPLYLGIICQTYHILYSFFVTKSPLYHYMRSWAHQKLKSKTKNFVSFRNHLWFFVVHGYTEHLDIGSSSWGIFRPSPSDCKGVFFCPGCLWILKTFGQCQLNVSLFLANLYSKYPG